MVPLTYCWSCGAVIKPGKRYGMALFDTENGPEFRPHHVPKCPKEEIHVEEEGSLEAQAEDAGPEPQGDPAGADPEAGSPWR